MFGFFKKSKGYPLPTSYSSFINKDEYNQIIFLCTKYFSDAGIKIIDIKEGEILIESGEETKHCYLDNLVRKVYEHDKSEWPGIIKKHFDILKTDPNAYKYFFKDFEYASELLRVLIKPIDILEAHQMQDFVYRVDFPETYTMLVIEYDNSFSFCSRENIAEWNVPDKELFKIAIANNPTDEVEAKKYLFLDKFTGFMFFSGDYAAGMLLDIENNAEYAIGPYGSMVAIPAKGFAFAAPIESAEILDLLTAVQKAVINSYNEDQGNISPNFYWYWDKKFVKFPVREEGEKTFIRLPNDLKEMLKS